MKFSVIMQVYLGDYEHAATDREAKLVRAVDSFLNQSFKSSELIIVCDGCEKSFDIIEAKYPAETNIICVLIKKQQMWSGVPRSYGIKKAVGEWICYLDADDYLTPDHLQTINDNVGTNDWVYFNDLVLSKNGNTDERNCYVNQRSQCGTSNVAHKRSLDVYWPGIGYAMDDWTFIEMLKRTKNFNRIATPGYVVCHVPKKFDL